MNVIIIEDEKPSARKLQRMLGKINMECEVLLHSVESSLTWFKENKHPDLIFLDIQLSDGLSFEIFEKVNIQSAVIFTTAYDEYALQAFKLNSIDYLLKPIDPKELHDAVEKYKSRIPKNNVVQVDFSEIRNMLVNPIERDYKKRFSVKIGQNLKLVEMDDVECFYSENKGTYVHNKDGRNYLLDDTLDQLMSELDPMSFFRVNRKFIIHIKGVKEMQVYSNSRLKITLHSYNDQEVIVAREKVKEYKAWLEK